MPPTTAPIYHWKQHREEEMAKTSPIKSPIKCSITAIPQVI